MKRGEVCGIQRPSLDFCVCVRVCVCTLEMMLTVRPERTNRFIYFVLTSQDLASHALLFIGKLRHVASKTKMDPRRVI